MEIKLKTLFFVEYYYTTTAIALVCWWLVGLLLVVLVLLLNAPKPTLRVNMKIHFLSTAVQSSPSSSSLPSSS